MQRRRHEIVSGVDSLKPEGPKFETQGRERERGLGRGKRAECKTFTPGQIPHRRFPLECFPRLTFPLPFL